MRAPICSFIEEVSLLCYLQDGRIVMSGPQLSSLPSNNSDGQAEQPQQQKHVLMVWDLSPSVIAVGMDHGTISILQLINGVDGKVGKVSMLAHWW